MTGIAHSVLTTAILVHMTKESCVWSQHGNTTVAANILWAFMSRLLKVDSAWEARVASELT